MFIGDERKINLRHVRSFTVTHRKGDDGRYGGTTHFVMAEGERETVPGDLECEIDRLLAPVVSANPGFDVVCLTNVEEPCQSDAELLAQVSRTPVVAWRCLADGTTEPVTVEDMTEFRSVFTGVLHPSGIVWARAREAEYPTLVEWARMVRDEILKVGTKTAATDPEPLPTARPSSSPGGTVTDKGS